MSESLKTYEQLPPIGTPGARVEFSYREWDRLRNLIQDSPEYDSGDPADRHLLAKLDWHCADTVDGGEP